jgi:hypothetical protein
VHPTFVSPALTVAGELSPQRGQAGQHSARPAGLWKRYRHVYLTSDCAEAITGPNTAPVQIPCLLTVQHVPIRHIMLCAWMSETTCNSSLC